MNSEVIFTSATFDLSADNYEEFDHKIEPEKLGHKLIQTSSIKGTNRKYQFYGSHHLLLELSKKKTSDARKFCINLAWLTSKVEHRKIIVWKWLCYALTTGTVSMLCLFIGITETIKLEYAVVTGTLSLTAALIFGLIFIYNLRDEFIFKSHYGGTKLFLIENKKPSLHQFDTFYKNLLLSIDNAQENISITDRLVGELKMSRHLKDQSIINDKAYIIARTKIFKHKQYKNK